MHIYKFRWNALTDLSLQTLEPAVWQVLHCTTPAARAEIIWHRSPGTRSLGTDRVVQQGSHCSRR